MPVQHISVVPARDTSSKSAPRPRDISELGKTPRRSDSRSGNLSKARNSRIGPASSKPVSQSPQDICSSGPLKRLEADTCVQPKRPSASSAQSYRKQVRRRHRRRKDARPSPEHNPSSEDGPPRRPSRRELPTCLLKAQVESTSEEEGWRQGRSREKARRGRQRGHKMDSGSYRTGADGNGEAAKRRAVGKEGNRTLPENGEGPVQWHRGRGPVDIGGVVDSGGRGLQEEGESGGRECREEETAYFGWKSHSHGSGFGLAGGEGGQLIAKRSQDNGWAGGEKMSLHSPRNRSGNNDRLAQTHSEDSELEVCRICHCEGEEECPLITPCRCTGSLRFVHQSCLKQWIRSSDTCCCELCKFDFIMKTQLKPLCKWEKLNMSKIEKRKVFCSVLFHLIAIALLLWSVYVLFQRTADELQQGKTGVLEWPFWTKLIMVSIGFTGGLVFMYIQCKVYLHLWRRLKAFNRMVTVQNCPEKALFHSHAPPTAFASRQKAANWMQSTVAVPVTGGPVAVTTAEVDSDRSVEDAVAPVQDPV